MMLCGTLTVMALVITQVLDEVAGQCTVEPPPVEHATHDGAGAPYADETIVFFRCDSGYSVDGISTIRCRGTQWTPYVGPKMECSPKSCGFPGEPENGRRVGNVYMVASQVMFHCNDGYELEGHDTTTCLANGKWTNSVPVCNVVECPLLPIPSNGRRKGMDRTYRNSVTFTCDRGYNLLGSETRQCQGDKMWSGQPASCHEIDCRPYKLGPHSTIEYAVEGNTKFSAVATVRCLPNAKFSTGVEHAVTYCVESGNWDPPAPPCLGCCNVSSMGNNSDPIALTSDCIPHGQSLQKNQFRCSRGNVLLLSSPSTECVNGSLVPVPLCEPIICHIPQIDHGGIVGKNSVVQYETPIEIQCNPGFEISVSSDLSCDLDLVYPTCEPGCCNVSWTGNNSVPFVPSSDCISHGQSLQKNQFRCSRGNMLHLLSPSTECVNGFLSPVPLCKPITCLIPLIANGGVVGEKEKSVIPYETQIEVLCNAGYEISGRPDLICDLGLEYPQCQPVNCVVPDINNGSVQKIDDSKSVLQPGVDQVSHDGEVRYVCDQGYIPDPAKSAGMIGKCDKGQLSPAPPVCIPAPCCTDFFQDVTDHPFSIPTDRCFIEIVDRECIKHGCSALVICKEDDVANATCSYGIWTGSFCENINTPIMDDGPRPEIVALYIISGILVVVFFIALGVYLKKKKKEWLPYIRNRFFGDQPSDSAANGQSGGDIVKNANNRKPNLDNRQDASEMEKVPLREQSSNV